MRLEAIKIENWKSIKHTHLYMHDLLILIGANNSGKSALNSAVQFLFQPELFTIECMGEQDLPLRVSGSFRRSIGGKEEELELTIFKFDHESRFIYMKDDMEITLEQYREEMGNFSLLHITSDLDNLSSPLEKFIGEIRCRFPKFEILSEIPEYRERFASRALFRNILFENLRNFLDFLEMEEIEKVEGIYIFFEHPEMFLMPYEERELYNTLVKLSRYGIFISIETLSSRFVGLQQYRSICMARNHGNMSTFFQFRGELFSGNEIKNFNMNYFINSDRGEIFFSKKVILVEGQTDKILISYLAEKLDIFRYDYCIVECGSKSLLPQFAKLLNSFHIRYVVVYDRDNHLWRSKSELDSSNHKNRQIHHSIDHDFGYWVEFDNDIEEEIYNAPRERKNYRNKPFVALQYAMSEDFKLTEKLKEKIHEIYDHY